MANESLKLRNARLSRKMYECNNCGDRKKIETNHFGSCYPRCERCGKSGFKCVEPEGIKLAEEHDKALKEHRSTIPSSIITKRQTRQFTKLIQVDGKKGRIEVKIRYDDGCGNGHNSFAITGALWSSETSSLDRCCEGMGCIHDDIHKYFKEFRHLIKWHGVTSDEPLYYLQDTAFHVKEGEFEHARSSAVWLDATEEQLRDVQALKDRLPALMLEFKKDMEAIGFIY